jgi:hypothetical protein
MNGGRMKSTKLYSGLVIILAAAATTAVVGCAGVEDTERATDTESSVRSVSLPCDDSEDSEGTDQSGQRSDQGSPCNGGAERSGNGSSGNCNSSQRGAPQGNYDTSQGGDEGPGYEGNDIEEGGGGDIPPPVGGVPIGGVVGGCAATYPVPYLVPVPVLSCGFGWGGWGGFGGFGWGGWGGFW